MVNGIYKPTATTNNWIKAVCKRYNKEVLVLHLKYCAGITSLNSFMPFSKILVPFDTLISQCYIKMVVVCGYYYWLDCILLLFVHSIESIDLLRDSTFFFIHIIVASHHFINFCQLLQTLNNTRQQSSSFSNNGCDLSIIISSLSFVFFLWMT